MQSTTTRRPHSRDQVEGRMADLGLSPESIARLHRVAEYYANQSRYRSEAIRLFTVANEQRSTIRGRSEGSQVWAITRDQHLATIMFRQSCQPSTPSALRVDRVTIVN